MSQYGARAMEGMVASAIFVIVIGCLTIVFRKPLARDTVKRYNQFYGLNLGRRATNVWEYWIVLIGVGLMVMGVLHLLGVGRAGSGL